MIGALIEAGDLAAADSACAAALARCRDTGDLLNLPCLLMVMADLDVQAGRFQDAAAHLREGLQIAMRAGDVVGCRQRPVVLRGAVHRDRALRRSRHAVGRPGRPRPAAGAHWRAARRGAQRGSKR